MQYDLTKPNTGRMIDYWLGGSHHFEIDRQLADQVTKQMPIVKDLVEEARGLVKRAVPYLYARGIRHFVDFGSALPTCDNTHLIAGRLDQNVKVLYSDIDPLTVAYGQEILQGDLNVIYLQCNAAEPRSLLDAPATHNLFGSERRVGILFLSLAQFLSDDQIHSAFQTLFDWCAPGSFLMMNLPSEHWERDPELQAVVSTYRRSNVTGYFRTRDRLRELVQPWRITAEGIADNAYWDLDTPPATYKIVGYSMMLQK